MYKSTNSLALGIVFVGFTTQFGGEFASGAQIYQYFINFGIGALVMPVVAQALLSLFYYYGMYEIEYFVMVCMAPAVAFATGEATLNALTGMPYLICTLIIGVFIFVIILFGTDVYTHIPSICRESGTKIVIIGGKKALKAAEEKIKEAIKRTEFVVLGTIIYGKNLQRLGWQSARCA